MNCKKMQQTGDEIRAKFALLESVPGSGYHDNDKDAVKSATFLAPQRNGLCKASENVVAFMGDYEVVFVGDDCSRVVDCCNRWVDQLKNQSILSVTQQKMRKAIVKLVIKTDSGLEQLPVLTLRRQLWNDYLAILYSEGQGISGQPLEEE